MRILFYTAAATGSGHLVRGLAVAAALRRSGEPVEFSILSAETPYTDLGHRFGVYIATCPTETEEALSPSGFRDSALFTIISNFNPDILIVDLYWAYLDAIIAELTCKKVFLARQVEPRFFHIRTPRNEYRFRPEDYHALFRIEPGFELPFPSRAINPVIIRNREEIKSEADARAELALKPEERACLFAFNGVKGDGVVAWKSFSYLEEEGWKVIRTGNREGGLFPAVDWFAAFDLVVCGAGYNAFWEARWFKKEAFFVPAPRRFENQARRPALFSDYEFETNGADELVRMLLAL